MKLGGFIPLAWLICLAALSVSLGSCSEAGRFRYQEGIVWNTIYHISYESAKDLSDSIVLIFEEIDSSLSPFNPSSGVSNINANLSDTFDCHFLKVYEESVKINRESDGAFDPTLAPLIRVWGFGEGHEISTDTLRTDSLLKIVGISKTHIKHGRLVKDDPRIEFNFSALAKGYGVDCIAELMERNGIGNFLIEVGGEIRARGHNAGGSIWSIGIDRPDPDAIYGETIAVITIENDAVATSGNYRNFHKVGTSSIGHTISSRNGRPVKTDILSATVIAPECMEADALATACMTLDSDEALSLCSRMRAGVMLVKEDLSVVTNPAFRIHLKE